MFDLLEQAKPKREPRPHQERAIQQVRNSIGSGNRRVILQGPTGVGKTFISTQIINGALRKNNRVLFTVPRIALIDQTISEFEREGIFSIGVQQATHPRRFDSALVQIASLDTLSRRIDSLDLKPGLVLIDEAHEDREVIQKMMLMWPDVPFIGLTATPWRKGMGNQWDDLQIPITISELIEQGYLSKFAVYAPYIPNLDDVRSKMGDYAEAALEEVMGEAKIVGGIVETWLARADNRPTLAFCVNRNHARSLHMQFERAGVASAYVDCMTDSVERGLIERRFRDGEVKVACSVRTLTTGVDWPVSCIIDAAPTKSEMLHVQKIGRGLRINEGTEDLLVLDHAGNSIRLGLVTDIHHDKLCTLKRGEKPEKKEKKEKLPKPCSFCEVLFTGTKCPACGSERQFRHGVEAADGELVELTGGTSPTMQDKQLFWSMALYVDNARGRGGRLAKALYRNRFGVWPKGLRDIVTEPNQAFFNYEKSRRIAYAKRMAKAREVAA